MSLLGLIPAGIGLLGNLFGKKKPTQYAAREDPRQAAQRQMMYQMLANLMRQGTMGMPYAQRGADLISRRFRV